MEKQIITQDENEISSTIDVLKKCFLTHVGKVIKKYRDKQNKSQKEVGKYMNLSNASISRFENGDIDLTAGQMVTLAHILHIPMRRYIQVATPDNEYIPSYDIDNVFKTLITELQDFDNDKITKTIDRLTRPLPPVPKYNTATNSWSSTTQAWTGIDKLREEIQDRDAFWEDAADKDMEAKHQEFLKYYDEASDEKINLLYDAYELVLMRKENNEPIENSPTGVIRATLNFATSDPDKDTERLLKYYKKWLECKIHKEMGYVPGDGDNKLS